MNTSTIIEIIVGVIVVLAGAFIALQFKTFQEWLVYAVCEAEEYFGSKTGQLKLRYVYNLAAESKFGWICSIVSYDMFDKFVQKALVKMKDMIANNASIAKFLEDVRIVDIDK